MPGGKPASAAKRSREGSGEEEEPEGTADKRARAEQGAVSAVLAIAIHRDGPLSTARSVVKPALKGLITFEGSKWRCCDCHCHGTNDGGTGATNGLIHAIEVHLSKCSQEALAAYVKASRGKVEKAVKALKAHEIAELCAAKPAIAATSEWASFTTPRQRLHGLARALGEGLGASNYPLNVGNSEFTGRLVHLFDPRAVMPSRQLITTSTDEAAVEAIVAVHKTLVQLREFLGSKALAARSLCVAADMWSADKAAACPGFLCLRLHWVDPVTFVQATAPLGFTHIAHAHTGEEMVKAFKATLQVPLGALDDIKKMAQGAELTGFIKDEQLSCTVTDGGSNIVKMVQLLRPSATAHMEARRQCACHLMETAGQNALTDSTMPQPVVKLLNTLKKLPVFFRKAPARMRALRKIAVAGLKIWAMGTIAKTRWYTRVVQGTKVLHNAQPITSIEVRDMQFTGKKKLANEAEFSEHKARLATSIVPMAPSITGSFACAAHGL